MLSHSFQMKLNRLADQFLHLVQRFARGAQTRQVGSICAPPRVFCIGRIAKQIRQPRTLKSQRAVWSKYLLLRVFWYRSMVSRR